MGYISIFNYSVTGDCSNTNSGAVYFEITGQSPTFSVNEITSTGSLPTSASTYVYAAEGLSAYTYFVEVTDSSGSKYSLPVYISSGTSVSIDSTDTTCGFDNGSITASTTNVYGQGSYYLYDSLNNITSTGASIQTYYVFDSLSADTYYVIADDGGGCTGSSASVLIKPSTSFDFGYYVVNDSSCTLDGNGKIFITGLTPSSAYTYNWLTDVNNQSGDTITGLTNGSYIVEVTSPDNCTTTKGIQVGLVPTVGLGAFIVTNTPTCFLDDGIVNVIITGGTAPYFYSANTGQVNISFSQTFTFTGVSAGLFEVSVTDAGLCNFVASTSVLSPNSFSQVNFITTNSNCSSQNGTITIVVDDGLTPDSTLNYSVSGASGYYQTVAQGAPTQNFVGLPSGDYIITVSDDAGCTFTGSTTIDNIMSFTLSANVTGTTCGFDNGIVLAVVSSGGTLPYNFTLTGPYSDPQIRSNFLGKFTDLPSGTYDLTVTDSSEQVCFETTNVYVTPSRSVNFDFYTIQPLRGGDGSINVYIKDGTPPFSYSWSGDVSGQTGLVITGLSSGEYALEITDGDNCSYKKSVILYGTKSVANYNIYTICDDNFQTTNLINRRGIRQMYWEGFYDLTSGDTNCIISAATFTITAQVGMDIIQQDFYTSTGFYDYPNDLLWAETVVNILNQFVGIGTVEIDIPQNKLTITTDCTKIPKNCTQEIYNPLQDQEIKVDLSIGYDIACVTCGFISPTPTITPTITPTPVTPTPTPTITSTPTTPTPTPTHTPPPTPTQTSAPLPEYEWTSCAGWYTNPGDACGNYCSFGSPGWIINTTIPTVSYPLIDQSTNNPILGQGGNWIAISNTINPGVVIYAVQVNSLGTIINVQVCP